MCKKAFFRSLVPKNSHQWALCIVALGPFLLVNVALYSAVNGSQSSSRRHANHPALFALSNVSYIRPKNCSGCFNVSVDVLQESPDLCSFSEGQSSSFMLSIISKPEHFQLRNAIRNTWLSPLRQNSLAIKAKYAFVVGLSNDYFINSAVKEEIDKYNDILLLNLQDTYESLTIKSIATFKHLSQQCQDVAYFVKADDDMFLSVKGLYSALLQHSAFLHTRGIGGLCTSNAKPYRDKNSKWFIAKHIWPNMILPRYCSGSLYFTGNGVLRRIVKESKNTPFFPMEDVYIGLVLENLGLQAKTVYGIHGNYLKDPSKYQDERFVSAHRFDIPRLYDVWNKTNSV